MIVMACNAMFCEKKKCKRKVWLLAWCFIQILSKLYVYHQMNRLITTVFVEQPLAKPIGLLVIGPEPILLLKYELVFPIYDNILL